MKNIFLSVFIVMSLVMTAQSKIDSTVFKRMVNEKLSAVDLSEVLNVYSNDIVGFIGSNYERFQIHYDTIFKDNVNPNVYHVKGKSMAKGNICDFEGIMTIFNVEEAETYADTAPMFGLDTLREVVIGAKYEFKENSVQKYSGVFQGTVTTQCYIDAKYKVHYDDLMEDADGYSNSECIGTWTEYDKKLIKVCNWGFKRAPQCGDLDVGAGEFAPNDKYKMNGWDGYCWYCTDEQNKSRKDWWK